jgi:16S rRNA (cytosine967-C5)-methyltransferase
LIDKRLGIANAHFVTADASELQIAPGDRVLVDAPCSGLGVLAKKPDAKWRRDVEDLEALTALQLRILSNASSLVKPGGVLVYSTCTTEPEENFDLVNSFLSTHGEFTIDPASQFVDNRLVNASGFVETYPHRDGMDGSFAIRLKKSSETPPD